MLRRTLVTGAGGALGSILTERLVSDGGTVAVLVRDPSALGALKRLRPGLDVRCGDVRDAHSLQRVMRGIDDVYHLAAVSVPINRLATEMWEVNVFGTYNVCRTAAHAGVRRIVHVSAAAAVGYPPPGVVASESFNVEESVSCNAYALTKRRGETVALGFNGSAMDVVVVNPCPVITASDRARSGWTRIIRAATRGFLRAVPSGGTGVCSTADFIDGIQRAMSHGRPGNRYILNSENLTYLEIGRLITRAVGSRPPLVVSPQWCLQLIGRINGVIAKTYADARRSPILVPENVDLLVRTLYYDQSKAIAQLGMTQTTIAAAIDDLCARLDQEAIS